jgi:hypothetical protein
MALADFVRRRLRLMAFLLVITVLLSAYVAFGKLLLDTRDAVNKDFAANLSSIAMEMGQYPSEAPNDDLVKAFCKNQHAVFLVYQSCYQRDELVVRKTNIHDLIKRWIYPFLQAASGEEVEQWAMTVIGVLGNYLLPVLYGGLGSLGFVLRRLNRQLADCLLTPRDLRANTIRIRLGTVTGACIGLFVNSSTGAATLTGIGGAAVTLSASGIAFLAGYGVETVFGMLDGLINHVFKIKEDRKEGIHG